jgi:hypothetical protein
MKCETTEAQQLVMQLDQLQDQHQLTKPELQQRRVGESRILGLAAIQKIKMCQRSRLTCIRLGDANSKLFHLCANTRRSKNHIPTLSVGDRQCTAHEDKEDALHSHFSVHLGQPSIHRQTLNWEALQLQCHDLSHLDDDLSESKDQQAIHQMPAEKASGLDGYIGAFFKHCWSIVKLDVVHALQEIFALRGDC